MPDTDSLRALLARNFPQFSRDSGLNVLQLAKALGITKQYLHAAVTDDRIPPGLALRVLGLRMQNGADDEDLAELLEGLFRFLPEPLNTLFFD